MIDFISKKLRLGATFLQAVLYIRINVVGIRLMRPEIVIVMLASKLFIRNMRAPMRLNRLLYYNEEAIIIEYRYRIMNQINHTTVNNTLWYKEI